MNKYLKIFSLTGLLLSSSLMYSCGGSTSSVTLQTGDEVFLKNAYVDLSSVPEKIQLKIELSANPIDLSIGPRIRVYSQNFEYSNGILTIDGKVLLDEEEDVIISSGDQSLKIRLENGTSVSTNILMVDKVIKTASDLQNINQNPQGSYILGNDIDCSSISNFEPLGFMESDYRADQEFLGIFDGNGYTISNITSKYSLDATTNLKAYEGHPLFTDESHSEGNNWGVFQTIGSSGIVRNLKLDNCKITGRTIVGVLCGSNQGLIENVFINDTCSALMSTHFYDDNCNVGGIVGINGGQINNVISLATCQIISTYTDYNDDYLNDNYAENETPINYHIFYSGDKGWSDSNGLTSTGVYAGIGKSWGNAKDCYALKFPTTLGFDAPFGQTHLNVNKPDDGPDKGVFNNCQIKDKTELKDISLYSNYSTDIWNIYEGSIPTFKAIYPTFTY